MLHRLDKHGKDFINILYDHFDKTGQWIGTKTLMVKFGPDCVDRLTRKYSPAYFNRWDAGLATDHYELTIKGIFHSKNSQNDRDLLLKFVSLLKDRFLENPEIQSFTKRQLGSALGIQGAQLERLRALIALLFQSYSNAYQDPDWSIPAPYDVHLLASKMSADQCVNHWIQNRLKQDQDRIRRSRPRFDKMRFGFWMLFISQTWSAFFLLKALYGILHPLLATACWWFTAIGISHLLQIFGIKNTFVDPKKVIDKFTWYAVTALISFLAVYFSRC